MNEATRKSFTKMSEADLKSGLAELDSQLQLIDQYRKEYTSMASDVVDLESSHVILKGMTKSTFLFHIKYYEFFNRFSDGAIIHPESKEIMNEANYLVENNLPVKKEVAASLSLVCL